MTTLYTLDEFRTMMGKELGVSDWITLSQEKVDAFAEVTDDHQWIHVNTARARSDPLGHTIAHGFLTASLLPSMLGQIYKVHGTRMTLNYGVERLRFPSSVASDARLRTRARLLRLEQRGEAVLSVVQATVEVDGQDKPGCVAEIMAHIIP